MGFIRNNVIVFSIYIIAISIACYALFFYDKHAFHIAVNAIVGNSFFNNFFFYITYFGDGRLAAVILLAILVYNVRTGIYATFSFLTATIICNSLKYFFYDDVNRPFFYFQYIRKHDLNLVEGVDMHIHNSFPSGHATQVFAILMCVAFVSRNQWVKAGCIALSIITSFSRIYLSQHWLPDVAAGSAIGFVTALAYYYLFIYHDRFARLNAPLSRLNRG